MIALLNTTPAKQDWSRGTIGFAHEVSLVNKKYPDKKINSTEGTLTYNDKMEDFLDSLGDDIQDKNLGKARRQLAFLIKLDQLSNNKSIKRQINKLKARIQLKTK